MDEGYWKSLLCDAESELEPATVAVEDPPQGEDESGESAVGILSGEPRKWDEGADGRDEADWQRTSTLLASGETIPVIVSGYNRGGLLADVGRLQGFLPASHLLVAPLTLSTENRMTALAGRVGESLTVRVVEIDRDRCRLILSERLARQDGNGDAILDTLRPGQTCEGIVTNLCPFGIFVDLGGFEGLVHISELSWGRVESPAEVARPGDRVVVMVLQVSPGEHKVSLSLKRLRPDPWQGVDDRYHAGQTLDAVITNVVNFGAFARLEPGLEGLVHISELAEGSFMHPRNVVNEGDQVHVRVLHVDSIKRRIALTMRSGEISEHGRSAVPAEFDYPG